MKTISATLNCVFSLRARHRHTRVPFIIISPKLNRTIRRGAENPLGFKEGDHDEKMKGLRLELFHFRRVQKLSEVNNFDFEAKSRASFSPVSLIRDQLVLLIGQDRAQCGPT